MSMNMSPLQRQLLTNQDLISPRFFLMAEQDMAETKKAGRPIFADKEYVEVKFAADRLRTHCAPAHEKYRLDKQTGEWVTYAQDFADAYQKFKRGEEQNAIGTPLSELTFLTESKRSELKALNIKNAEALAALDGEPLKMLGMGGRDLKNKAMAYLEHANGTARELTLAAENAAMRQRMEEMEAMMAELQAAVATGVGKPEAAEVAKKARKAKAPARAPSPFDDYGDDDIKTWMVDSGGTIDAAWSRDDLVAAADRLNAELAEKQKAA